MNWSMMRTLVIACAAASALALTATAANAIVITYDSSPVGGPPVGADAFNNPAVPVISFGTVVDLGGGNHALSLPVLPTFPQAASVLPHQEFRFTSRTSEPGLSPGFVYDWRLNSFDVWASQDTRYSFWVSGAQIGSGTLLANQWTTFSFGSPGVAFDVALFGIAPNLGAVLLDNVTYTFIGSHAVPEPATWGMLILGFGLIGGAMRRRRSLVPG